MINRADAARRNLWSRKEMGIGSWLGDLEYLNERERQPHIKAAAHYVDVMCRRIRHGEVVVNQCKSG